MCGYGKAVVRGYLVQDFSWNEGCSGYKFPKVEFSILQGSRCQALVEIISVSAPGVSSYWKLCFIQFFIEALVRNAFGKR